MSRKVDAGFVQDAWHYALAMQCDTNSTFPCETLTERLDAARAIRDAIDRLSMGENGCLYEWDKVRPRPERMITSADLVRVGRDVQEQCEKWGRDNNIDPRSGDPPDAARKFKIVKMTLLPVPKSKRLFCTDPKAFYVYPGSKGYLELAFGKVWVVTPAGRRFESGGDSELIADRLAKGEIEEIHEEQNSPV